MDGCSWFQMLRRVLLPVAIPGLIAAGMFAFMTAWNDYLFAVILTSTTASKTLPVVVAGFVTDVTTERTLMATSGVLAVVPPPVQYISTVEEENAMARNDEWYQRLSRRDFLKATTMAGLGAGLGSAGWM